MRIASSPVTLNQINTLTIFLPETTELERKEIITNGASQFVYMNDIIVAYLGLDKIIDPNAIKAKEKKEKKDEKKKEKENKDKSDKNAVEKIKEEKKAEPIIPVKLTMTTWIILDSYQRCREALEDGLIKCLKDEAKFSHWISIKIADSLSFSNSDFKENKTIVF